MRIVARTLLVAGVVAGSAVVTAPSASACAGVPCYTNCVLGIVEQVAAGDLFITCRL